MSATTTRLGIVIWPESAVNSALGPLTINTPVALNNATLHGDDPLSPGNPYNLSPGLQSLGYKVGTFANSLNATYALGPSGNYSATLTQSKLPGADAGAFTLVGSFAGFALGPREMFNTLSPLGPVVVGIVVNNQSGTINDSQPTVSSTIKNGAIVSGSVTPSSTSTAATIKTGGLLTASISNGYPNIGVTLTRSSLQGGVAVEPSPVIDADVLSPSMTNGAITDNHGSVSGNVTNYFNAGLCVESQASISVNFASVAAGGYCVESEPTTAATFLSPRITHFAASETKPTLSTHFINQSFMRGAVSGGSPTVSASVLKGGKLTAAITDNYSTVLASSRVVVSASFAVALNGTSKAPIVRGLFKAPNIQTGAVVEPSPGIIVSPFTINYLSAAITEPFGSSSSGRIAGGKLFKSDLNESSVSVSATIYNPVVNRFAAEIAEDKPTISAAITSEVVVVGSVKDAAPSVVSIIANAGKLNPRCSEAKPQVQSVIISEVGLRASVKEPKPIVAGKINEAVGNVRELRPQSSGRFIAGRLLTGSAKVLKSSSSISALVIASKNLKGKASEDKPNIAAVIHQESMMDGGVIEGATIAKSDMSRGLVFYGNVIDITKILVAAKIDSKKDQQTEIIDKRPAVHGWVENRKVSGSGNYLL
jgi:hypothetical protein